MDTQSKQANTATDALKPLVSWLRAGARTVAKRFARITAPTPPIEHNTPHEDPKVPGSSG